MKITSNQTNNQLTVQIDDVVDKAKIMDTLAACADGQCACSTDEYQKVQTLQISDKGSSIQLDIEVKDGEVIDPNCISECLS